MLNILPWSHSLSSLSWKRLRKIFLLELYVQLLNNHMGLTAWTLWLLGTNHFFFSFVHRCIKWFCVTSWPSSRQDNIPKKYLPDGITKLEQTAGTCCITVSQYTMWFTVPIFKLTLNTVRDPLWSMYTSSTSACAKCTSVHRHLHFLSSYLFTDFYKLYSLYTHI